MSKTFNPTLPSIILSEIICLYVAHSQTQLQILSGKLLVNTSAFTVPFDANSKTAQLGLVKLVPVKRNIKLILWHVCVTALSQKFSARKFEIEI